MHTKKQSTQTKILNRQTKRLSMINKTLITPRKNQVGQKISSMITKIPSTPTKNLRCFVARQFLSQIYALFWRTFCRPKSMVAYQKGQISGMVIRWQLTSTFRTSAPFSESYQVTISFCFYRTILSTKGNNTEHNNKQ